MAASTISSVSAKAEDPRRRRQLRPRPPQAKTYGPTCLSSQPVLYFLFYHFSLPAYSFSAYSTPFFSVSSSCSLLLHASPLSYLLILLYRRWRGHFLFFFLYSRFSCGNRDFTQSLLVAPCFGGFLLLFLFFFFFLTPQVEPRGM